MGLLDGRYNENKENRRNRYNVSLTVCFGEPSCLKRRSLRKRGAKINTKAEICPKCGVRQSMPAAAAAKDPTIAALLSFLWCGAGHVYIGKLDKGVILAISYGITLFIGVLTLVCLPIPLVLWIYGIYDAYTEAKNLA
jgi:TM2 domain-containing membrane protein YozV